MKTKLYLIQAVFIFSFTFLTIVLLTKLFGFNNSPLIAGISGGIGVLLSPWVRLMKTDQIKAYKLVWFKKVLNI